MAASLSTDPKPPSTTRKPPSEHPHAPLPGRLSIDETYILHTLSVLSSSKIHNRVRRVLQLLDLQPDPPDSLFTSVAAAGTKTRFEHTQSTSLPGHIGPPQVQPGQPQGQPGPLPGQLVHPGPPQGQHVPPHGRPSPPTQPGAQKPVLVRLSARAPAAAKLVSIVEIVKREAAAGFAREAAGMFERQKTSGEKKTVAKARVAALKVFQYNALTSVEEVAESKEKGGGVGSKMAGQGRGVEREGAEAESEDVLGMPKGRRRGKRKRVASLLEEEKAGSLGDDAVDMGGEGSKRVCTTKATVEEYRRALQGKEAEMDYGDAGAEEAARGDLERSHRDGDTEPDDESQLGGEDEEEVDDDGYFGTLAPAGDRAGTRAAAKLAEILEFDGGGGKRGIGKKKKHPVPVMTIYLCRQSVWELREAYGEQSTEQSV